MYPAAVVDRVRGASRTSVAFGALCAVVAAAALWNAAHYPPLAGYDAADHAAYADGLIPGLDFPQGEGEYYTPPGYYALAGTADWLGRGLGLGEPRRLALALNVLLLLGTVWLVRRLALELWPGRERLALAAAAFAGLVPVAVKAAAMFHPETLSLFLATLALWLCVRAFRDPRYAVPLGLALGAGQLVRAFALWTVAAAAIALVVGRRWRVLAVALVLAALIPAPWYLHQRLEYGGSPVFNRPTVDKPIYERRPAAFYLDPGLPEVVTKPYRPHFLNRALPTTYTELWGDYFGIWAWNGRGVPDDSTRRRLQLQSVTGFLPTLLAVAGWLALLAAALRSPPRLAVALLPGLGILGYLYFTVSYPTPDGDVLKATYMLSTLPGWALGFGLAVDRLGARTRVAAVSLLAACVAVQLPYLFYG